MISFIREYKKLMLINAAPYLLWVLLFVQRAPVILASFLPILLGLVFINFSFIQKISHFILMQTYVLVCYALSITISASLYYFIISSDEWTVAVGLGFIFWGSIITFAVSALAALMKLVFRKRDNVWYIEMQIFFKIECVIFKSKTISK